MTALLSWSPEQATADSKDRTTLRIVICRERPVQLRLKVLVNSFVSHWPSQDITRSVKVLRRSGFIMLELNVDTEVIRIRIYRHLFALF